MTLGDAQFEGAREPGGQGHGEDGSDEDRGDLDALGAFDDVRDRCVDEDQR